jgi:hypothetical protein
MLRNQGESSKKKIRKQEEEEEEEEKEEEKEETEEEKYIREKISNLVNRGDNAVSYVKVDYQNFFPLKFKVIVFNRNSFLRVRIYDEKTKELVNVGGFFRMIEKYFPVTLPGGNIAIFGGSNFNDAFSKECWLYNVRDKVFSRLADTIEHRYNVAAVLLCNGKVLLVGGHDASDRRTSQIADVFFSCY